MSKIYLASSWRNDVHYNAVLNILREAGHKVYDFRQMGSAFAWQQIDSDWQSWTPQQYRDILIGHPLAQEGFHADMAALHACDTCVLVLPCGRSAHLELGWAVGAGKRTKVIMLDKQEPELMYRMTGGVLITMAEVEAWAYGAIK